jgi:glycosyltransferase involved in cell wall biosynthesis
VKPLVSILIPAYNAEPWIAECLASAVAQTWPRTEIIVVDDGSTDATVKIASSFSSDKVTVVAEPHRGAAAARNKALSLSRGDYIQWLDADDLLGPDKIELQLQLLEQFPSRRTLLSSAWGAFIYRQPHTTFIPTALWCDQSPLDWLSRKMEHNIYMQTGTWLVSRELTEEAGPWDTRLSYDDDGEYFCRVLLRSDGVRFAPSAKVHHRRRNPTRLSFIGRSHEKMSSAFQSVRSHVAYLRSLEDSERTRAICVRYLQNSLTIFHPDRPDLIQQARAMATELGGHLEAPRLSWKYAWIAALFGADMAKRAQVGLPVIRWSVIMFVDWVLFLFDPPRPTAMPW